jgi:pyruvyltransferase
VRTKYDVPESKLYNKKEIIMNKNIRYFIENIKLLFNSIIINAFVFYDESGIVCHKNWGDDINYYFLKEICKRPVAMFDQFSLTFRLNLKNYLVIGSTIDMLCKKNTEVWGAGIIDGTIPLKTKPKKVYAVRGPLTRQALLQQGIECPEVYGDPAMLVAKYYKPHVTKKYKYGFISHVSNIDKVNTLLIDGTPLKERKDILIIDFSNYNRWTDIPDRICSCENIISGSLHGLIMAEAYNIPNVWIQFGKPLIGGYFKFHDFFLSISRDRKMPISINNGQIESKIINEALASWQPGHICLQQLIDACPFELKADFKI